MLSSAHCFFHSTEIHTMKWRSLSAAHSLLRWIVAFPGAETKQPPLLLCSRSAVPTEETFSFLWPFAQHSNVFGFRCACLPPDRPSAILIVMASSLRGASYVRLETFVLVGNLTCVCTSSSEGKNIPPIGSIFGEKLLPTLLSKVIFSISGCEGKCLAKA